MRNGTTDEWVVTFSVTRESNQRESCEIAKREGDKFEPAWGYAISFAASERCIEATKSRTLFVPPKLRAWRSRLAAGCTAAVEERVFLPNEHLKGHSMFTPTLLSGPCPYTRYQNRDDACRGWTCPAPTNSQIIQFLSQRLRGGYIFLSRILSFYLRVFVVVFNLEDYH